MVETDCCEKKESSSTAKTALGLAIGGLGLAAVNSGLLGGGCGDGFLGGLFGGRSNCGNAVEDVYHQQEARIGERAQIELNMVNSYFMPTWHELCELKKEVAVNRAVDVKNQEITGLLFRMADERTNAAFALASANNTCVFQRLDYKIDADTDRLNAKVDAAFAYNTLNTNYAIERATCNVIKGAPYISPTQMADPYMAAQNILISRQVMPVTQPVPAAAVPTAAAATAAAVAAETACGCPVW